MRLSDFRALSFDCYGTLIDWDSGISAVLGPWAKDRGLDISAEQLLATYAAKEAEVEAELPHELYPGILAESFARVGVELGASVSADDRERLATSVPDWPAFSDSAEALASLHQYYQLIILSNIDNASFAKSNTKLGVTFDAILTAEDIGSYKPAQRNFDVLSAHLRSVGLDQSQLLHVAESLFHDHVPAQRRGVRTVRILRQQPKYGWGATPRPTVDVEPHWEFASLAEFARARAEDEHGS
ncbi:HAD family hydrolase [Dactylosporangium maewongense]|uniref:HAD family hydrolase n=1 Tax=Dactylosporangium maewongense TaxID=634393 RepID=A0ABP4PDB6_9ACTN